jgi:hypothetical protein
MAAASNGNRTTDVWVGVTLRTRATMLNACFCAIFLAAVSCTNPSTPTASGARISAPATPTAQSITPGAASSSAFSVLPWSGDPGSPDPIMDCRDAGGVIGPSDPVAIVQPHGRELALRDYADPANPRTLCRFSNPRIAQLIDSRHIVVRGFGAPNIYAVVDLPEVRYHWFQLKPEGSTGCADLLGVSRGLDAVTWRGFIQGAAVQTIHVTTAAGDRAVATLPRATAPLGACGARPVESDAYSASGRYFYVLDRNPQMSYESGPPLNSLLVIDGAQALLQVTPPPGGWAPDAEPSMPVWSPVSDTLYYVQGGQVWTWDPATGARPFLPGVSWCYPTISADGRYLAYAARRSDGLYDVDLLDLTSGQVPHAIGKGPRNLPAFLNSSLVWYMTWNSPQCGEGYAGYIVVGQPLIYDTHDGSEASSGLDWVFQVWPATGYAISGVWPDSYAGRR